MFIYPSRYHIEAHTPKSKLLSLGCSAFARRYSQNRIRFLFLCLLRCFTSAGFALWMLFIHTTVTGFKAQLGFPIRRSLGIMTASVFPRLIAGNHVLHRLLAPRHSPRALSSLSNIKCITNKLYLLAPTKLHDNYHLSMQGFQRTMTNLLDKICQK